MSEFVVYLQKRRFFGYLQDFENAYMTWTTFSSFIGYGCLMVGSIFQSADL